MKWDKEAQLGITIVVGWVVIIFASGVLLAGALMGFP